jgi:phosphatidylglycerol:prolipoprotein diacylglycerol transferase
MYPTLFHAVHDLLGVDLQVLKLINTFGFLVALAFLAAARTLSSELARKHGLGLLPSTRRLVTPPRPTTLLDVVVSGVVAFLIGFKFFGVALGDHTLQGGSDTQRYLLSTNGHLVAGLICGVGWMLLRFREMRSEGPAPEATGKAEYVEVTPREHTLGITGAAALGGLIGAKVFHFLERPKTIIEFFEHPSLSALFSGLTIYGGLIVGTLFVYMYARRHKLPFVHVADAVAPGLMLAYGIGRLGCQLSGDGDWGIPSAGAPEGFTWLPSWFWSYDYPNNVLGAGVRMSEGGFPGYGTHLVPPVYPTPLYEALTAFVLFGVLWALRTRLSRPLAIFGVYMILNGIERFWIEKIRVNATYEIFGHHWTQAEIISVGMFFGGILLLYWSSKHEAKPAPVIPADADEDEDDDADEEEDDEDENDLKGHEKA